jgi:signal-transduction protein with cAMP-binding, CBS, and nucleotidyltransferase domain
MNEKLSFLYEFPVLSKLSKESLKNFLPSVEIKIFKFGTLIFKENQPSENIYFIKNGEIEISKLINKDFEELIPDAANFEEAIEQTEILQKTKLAAVNRVWSAQNSRKCNKRFTVLFLKLKWEIFVY